MTTSRRTRRQLLRDAGLVGVLGTLPAAGHLLAGGSAQAASTAVDRIYVATDGDDRWSGRLERRNAAGTDGPLATLAAARDAVRRRKRSHPLTRPLEVVLRGGTYYLPEPLVLTPEDSGTAECPIVWRSAPGERAVISGGRPITGRWTRGADGVWSTRLATPWSFRTLFVNGRRETLARFPNPDPEQPGRGYIFHGGQHPHQLLAGLARGGDYVEYRFTVTTAATYDLWLGVATAEVDNQNFLAVTVDGAAVPLSTIDGSGGYRVVKYSKAAGGLELGAGEHRIRIANTTPRGGDHRVHLDALVFTTDAGFAAAGTNLPPLAGDEHRVVVQAEDDRARVAGLSSIRFQKFPVPVVPATNATKLYADPALVKASWKDDPEALVDAVPAYQYWNELLPITAIDPVTGIVTVDRPANALSFAAGNYFFVSGVRSELDTPGEFYLDSHAGRLDYLPRPGEDPNSATFVAPHLDRLVTLRGDATGTARVEWVTLRGLEFRHTKGSRTYVSDRSPTDAAIQLDCAWHCTVEDCRITGVDGYGIWLHLDSCENTVRRNEIDDIGVGGVLLSAAVLDYGIVYDDRPEVQDYAPLRNAFLRNHIHHGGRVRVLAAGFNLGSRPDSTALAAGNLIAFNDVHDMTRQGVFGFRNQGGNVIAYNRFTDVITSTADTGAINLAVMTNLAAPNLVRNNVVRGARGLLRISEDTVYGYGVGLYPDHSSSHFWFENNLVVDASYPFLANGGQFNTLVNNVLADPGQVWVVNPNGVLRDNVVRGNVLANVHTTDDLTYRLDVMPPLLDAAWAAPGRLVDGDRNVLFNGAAPVRFEPLHTLAAWQAAGNDARSVAADPRFVDPARGDYRLRASSPAFALGFRPIDLGNTGVAGQAPLPAIASMAAVFAAAGADPVGTDGRAVRCRPAVGEPGMYRVYARRTSNAARPQKLDVVVRHAAGEARVVLDEMTGPGNNPEPRFGLFLGTYPFRPGAPAEVVATQPGTATPDLPSGVLLLRVPRPRTDLAQTLWEATATVTRGKLAAGERTTVTVHGLLADGRDANLRRARIRYASSAPEVATVDSAGTLAARGPGLATVTATVTLGEAVVRTPPVRVLVGDILWEVSVTAEDALLGVGEITRLVPSGRTDTGGTPDLSAATIEYASDRPEVVVVDAAGRVTAKGTGSATLTATVTLHNITLAATTTVSVVAGLTPLLAYAFDESGTGTEAAADGGTAPPAPGSFHGAARRTAQTPSGSGGALDLTAGAGFVTPGVGGSAKLDALPRFTLALWLRLAEDPAAFDRILGRGAALDWYVLAGSTAGAVATLLQIGPVAMRPPVFDAREWQFLAVVGDGSRLTVYHGDRTSAVTTLGSQATAAPLAAAPGVELRLGATTLTTADRTPPAYLDGFRIYGLALPPAELDQIRRGDLAAGA
ncbi:Ig-like domain-containing protein [Plantactinospora sp. DSM 117369]